MRTLLRAVAALAALAALAGPARAIDDARVDVDVTITAYLSVKVEGVASSTASLVWSGTPNQAFASDAFSSATVTNDSVILTERWMLSTNAQSINTAGNLGVWSVAASSSSVGPDQFALQAVFGSSNTTAGGCPAAAHATWNDATTAPLLTATPAVYTTTRFAASALNNDGRYQPDQSDWIWAGRRRALCWRLIMPQSTGTADTQNIQLLVTATP